MTPTPDSSENRRSFVKKTLATTVTISFAGLIRAHGEESGGTTTWNPDAATFETTDSGGTTTWNPDIPTSGDGLTTWNPDQTSSTTEVIDTTWNPDEETIETTQQATAKACSWITKIKVEFNDTVNHPPDNEDASDAKDKSGRIFKGTMTCTRVDCSGREIEPLTYEVETGGYIQENPLKKGSDTGCPAGTFTVARKSQEEVQPNRVPPFKIPDGHRIPDDKVAPRTDILVHAPIRNPGSSGCIVITGGKFAEWSQEMHKKPCYIQNGCGRATNCPDPVPISVSYTEAINPPVKTILGP